MNSHPAQRRQFLQNLGLAASLAALTGGMGLLSACGKTGQGQALPAGSTVLALGDSLTQGVGAQPAQAWPQLLAHSTGWHIINAGISGHTSAQALERLPELLQNHRPQLVIIGIGGNDFLRQQSPEAAKHNIRLSVQLAQASGAQVLLLAMPRFSLIAATTGRMSDHPLYAELGKELQVPVLEQSWSRILSEPSLRADAVHANAQGYAQYAQSLEAELHRLGLIS